MDKDKNIQKVVVAIVNYYSCDEVLEYMETIRGCEGVTLIVVNNGEDDDKLSGLRAAVSRASYATLLDPGLNLGYMGGARFAYEALGGNKLFEKADWFVLSNADVRFDARNLTDGLDEIDFGSEFGVPMVVAPRIQSSLTGKNQNPYMISRPSRIKYKILGWVFSVYPLAVAHRLLGMIKQRLFRSAGAAQNSMPSIYGGHGSFIIFSKRYFERGGGLDNGAFLFCEENYVAEEVRRMEGRIVYADDIVITHKEHVTTGILPSRVMTRYLAKAHKLCASRYMQD